VPITLTDALAQELGELFEGDQLEINDFEYILYEESNQINELKHVLWDRIYKRNDDKFFVQHCSKSGSYWSDYEFSYGDELYEVKKVEVKTLEWKLV
jgi:hypothetical protein